MGFDEVNKTFIQGEGEKRKYYKGMLSFVDVPRRVHVLWTTEILIGRDPVCDICFPDKAVSRKHASINLALDGARFTDLSSANGSFRNGEKVEGTIILNNEDVIEIGGAFQLKIKIREKDELVQGFIARLDSDEYLLTQSEVLIGRDPDRVDIVIADTQMNDVQAQIEFIFDTPIITNLAESAPFIVDNLPTNSTRLREFSAIRIGVTKLTWRY